jgi:hypothetical protein
MESGSPEREQTAVGECAECGATLLVTVTEADDVDSADPIRGHECGCGSTEFRRLPADEAFSRIDE